jgi:hypothetical protein
MHYFWMRPKAGFARRAISLVFAHLLLVQAVFTCLIVTQHALAAGTPGSAFAVCSGHEDSGGAPQNSPAKTAHHFVPCTVCISAASSLGVLPGAVFPPLHFQGFAAAFPWAVLPADLLARPSPKRSQGPPLTA